MAYTPEPMVTEGASPIVHADIATPGHAGRRLGVGLWSFDGDGQLSDHYWKSLPLTPDIQDDVTMARWVSQNR